MFEISKWITFQAVKATFENIGNFTFSLDSFTHSGSPLSATTIDSKHNKTIDENISRAILAANDENRY